MHDDLMEQVAGQENLRRALAAVKRNHGAAGIDGRTTGQLASHLARHGEKIRAKLLAGRWTPSPLQRVAIPKPHGGKRLLGIPTVIERLLQPALLQVLTPIFEPLCSEPGYGFRPGRSAHGDSELDRETSATASERGEERGGAGRPWERKFLGFRINRRGQREAAPQSVERLKQKVREIWRSCRSVTSRQLRDERRRYIAGWWGYDRLAEGRRAIFWLEGWIRRHIRKCFWLCWHGVRGRGRALRRLGVPEWKLRYVPARRGAWFVAARAMMHTALSNRNLQRYGFWMPSDLAASS